MKVHLNRAVIADWLETNPDRVRALAVNISCVHEQYDTPENQAVLYIPDVESREEFNHIAWFEWTIPQEPIRPSLIEKTLHHEASRFRNNMEQGLTRLMYGISRACKVPSKHLRMPEPSAIRFHEPDTILIDEGTTNQLVAIPLTNDDHEWLVNYHGIWMVITEVDLQKNIIPTVKVIAFFNHRKTSI